MRVARHCECARRPSLLGSRGPRKLFILAAAAVWPALSPPQQCVCATTAAAASARSHDTLGGRQCNHLNVTARGTLKPINRNGNLSREFVIRWSRLEGGRGRGGCGLAAKAPTPEPATRTPTNRGRDVVAQRGTSPTRCDGRGPRAGCSTPERGAWQSSAAAVQSSVSEACPATACNTRPRRGGAGSRSIPFATHAARLAVRGNTTREQLTLLVAEVWVVDSSDGIKPQPRRRGATQRCRRTPLGRREAWRFENLAGVMDVCGGC